jgi:hypothetical protein
LIEIDTKVIKKMALEKGAERKGDMVRGKRAMMCVGYRVIRL